MYPNKLILYIVSLLIFNNFILNSDQKSEHKKLLEKSITCFDQHDYESSLLYAKKAQLLKSNDVETIQQLGQAYLFCDETEIALSIFSQIRDRIPQQAQVEYNIGYVYARRGETHKVIESMHRALALNPQHQLSHVMLGEAYLKLGYYEKGWEHFSWHWKKRFTPGCWDTINFNNKTVLINDVQGIGDSLQFVRYVRELKKRGAFTIVNTLCTPLAALYARCPYIDSVRLNETSAQLPFCELFAPMMALPMIFGANEKNIPQEPFLNADPQLVQQWHHKIAQLSGNTFKIALSWHADQKCELTKSKNERKSISLQLLLPLLKIPGISFYSLQKLEGVEELEQLPAEVKIHHFDDIDTQHGRFMDTAAIIENMDLVISVDTSIAHVAAGLGKPTWMILNYPGDWRWLEDRSDSPWYPTMKIFRKRSATDWQSMVREMETELVKLVKKTNIQSHL